MLHCVRETALRKPYSMLGFNPTEYHNSLVTCAVSNLGSTESNTLVELTFEDRG